jgi:ATP-dependent Lon protease
MQVSGYGNVSLILTGQLGDVMKESARAALTYAATHAGSLNIPDDRLGSVEVHVHVPPGAIPKDGPSAGTAMSTAIVSAMSGRPVRPRRGDDRRGDAARARAADRRPQGEGARRAPRGDHHDHPPQGERGRHGGHPRRGARAAHLPPVETLDEVFDIALLPADRPVHGAKTVMEEMEEAAAAR